MIFSASNARRKFLFLFSFRFAAIKLGFQFLNLKQEKGFKKGFTLLELLIIIAISGALILGAIPAFRSFRTTLELGSFTQELVGDLRYVQQLSVTEQKEYCLQFLPSEGKYYLKKCEGEIIKERIILEEIEIFLFDDFTDNEVRYNPYGAVKEPGTIVLTNKKNETKTILVKPSGFISVTD